MAYAIHIERRAPDGRLLPIELSECCAVVTRTDGVRLLEGNFQATNPNTQEVITLTNAGGDAEVFSATDARWQPGLRWSSSGRISFRAPRDFAEPTSAMRRLALELARRLNARLFGDEGEVYD